MKKEIKRRYRRDKRRQERERSGVGDGGFGLKLAQNKVLAGHLRKMRDAKDITKKFNDNIAYIFG